MNITWTLITELWRVMGLHVVCPLSSGDEVRRVRGRGWKKREETHSGTRIVRSVPNIRPTRGRTGLHIYNLALERDALRERRTEEKRRGGETGRKKEGGLVELLRGLSS